MRFVLSEQVYSYGFGVYTTNWGYPIGNNWEIGIIFWKWNIGIQFGEEI